jgi:hypothetical protein
MIGAGAPTFPAHLTLRVLVDSSSISEGSIPPQGPILDLSQPNSRLGQIASRSPARWFSCRSWWIPSCFVAAVSGLRSLSQFWVPVSSDVSSRNSVFSRFLVPCCPWSDFSRPCPLAPCHYCTVGHCSASIGQCPPSPVFRLSAAFCS